MDDPGDRADVAGTGLSVGLDGEESVFAPIAGGRAVVRCVNGLLVLDGSPWEAGALRFHLAENVSNSAAGDKSAIRVGRSRVRGDLVVRAHRNRLQLINVLPLEDYLLGVVGAEMPWAFPDDALKAQAVAARTYALKKKLDSVEQPFHLGSGVLHQVYRGLMREDARIRSLVEATRGEILTYNLEPIEAYFHASCGGLTESGQMALGRGVPYLQPVECPCGKAASSRWELSLTSEELGSAIGVKAPPSLSIASRSETGRVRMLSAGSGHFVDAVDFRQRLGYGKLKSLWFDVERSGDGIRIKGRGFGHGAGMCQWGAKALADAGWTYRQILLHYYRGVEIQQIY